MYQCLDNFNLIVTCQRHREYFTVRELESILYIVGVKDYKICKSKIRGVILAYVNANPHEVIKKFRNLLIEKPWEFRNIKRVIPIDIITSTDYDKISRRTWELAKRIPLDAAFKVQVKKRYTDLSSRRLIELIASRIDRRVNLNKPDFIINVEILGDVAAISLIRENEILSVEKELLK